MSALGWRVGDPDVERDQLQLDLDAVEREPELAPEPDDDLTWDEWIRSLPRTP